MEKVFYEIFSAMPRQGPGSKTSTIRALKAIPELPDSVDILDVGCGTGNQTMNLANEINGKIVAVDNYQPFIDTLNKEAKKKGLTAKIEGRTGDMFHLHLGHKMFDIIWSEGAVYIMGLENALKKWKKYLKPKGYIVVSDFNWMTNFLPDEVYNYFIKDVPNAGTAEDTIERINASGYRVIDHFPLPEKEWLDFYSIHEEILEHFRKKYHDQPEAGEVIDMMQYEADLYKKYQGSYGYNFYIMQANT